jgi:hypothetical protein
MEMRIAQHVVLINQARSDFATRAFWLIDYRKFVFGFAVIIIIILKEITYKVQYQMDMQCSTVCISQQIRNYPTGFPPNL